ncbi:MAG: hypothetical protein R3Y54_07265 [Eubacteriales bacterium]
MINKFKIGFKKLINRTIEIMKDNRGDATREDIEWILLGGVKFIVNTFFKNDTNTTIEDKIQRLVDKESSNL